MDNRRLAWQATHRDLSYIDLRFREMAKDSPDFLDLSRFQALDENKELLKYQLQPWLTFLGREKLDELKRVSLGVIRLLRGLQERIFGNDWVKLAEFYDLGSPDIAEVVFSAPTGAETMISRGDLIDTPSGFKCIEFNCIPNLGGWDANILLRRHLSIPATAQFIATEGIQVASTDPIQEMFRHIFADLRRKRLATDGQVTIGFSVRPGYEKPDTHPWVIHFQREMNRAIERLDLDISGRVASCSMPTLTQREQSLYYGDLRLDALVELDFGIEPFIYRLFKRGCLALYNGPIGVALSTKRNLALLSQHAASGIFSEPERAFIEAHIPWSRLVAAGTVEYEGEIWQLSDLLSARQDRFVLKKGTSAGGKDVLLGRFAPAEEWRKAIETALGEGGWVAQEIQESLPYLYQSGAYGCSVHDMIWGPFVFGDQYGGVILRMQPKDSGGAVNLSRTATEGIVLEV
jgi:hypothetical protein